MGNLDYTSTADLNVVLQTQTYQNNQKTKETEKKENTVHPVFNDILSSIEGMYGPACRSYS
jgi:hypothetical protein